MTAAWLDAKTTRVQQQPHRQPRLILASRLQPMVDWLQMKDEDVEEMFFWRRKMVPVESFSSATACGSQDFEGAVTRQFPQFELLSNLTDCIDFV